MNKWTKISDKLPKVGTEVDLWVEGKRFPSYVLVKNYCGKKGNNFFSPIYYGITCIRFDGDKNYTQATHWMDVPLPPTGD